ncbi:MAG: hypothetical protein V1858_04310 [Candidatus Gottesmanbacteria bacterium]
MLTKADLQAIDKIVKSEIAVSDRLLRGEMKTMGNELRGEMNNGFKRVEKKLDYISDFWDRNYLKLLQRVERIEKHLGLEPISP